LKLWKTTLLLGCTAIAFGQGEYGGPSVLSRGQGPSNGLPAETTFRPYAAIQGIYDSGLLGVTTDSSGNVTFKDAYGVQAEAGLYGQHSWEHTTIGLDYRGSYRRYSQRSYFDGSDHVLTLSINRQISKRIGLSLRESGGTFQRSFWFYNPGQLLNPGAQIPVEDVLDNRMYFGNTAADMTYQKSARLSFHGGGEGFIVRRTSDALFGVLGVTARGDVAYRYGRHGTVGLDYYFTRFDFFRAFGDSTINSLGLNWAKRVSRTWELAVRIGVARVESLFLQRVLVDPEVRAITGQAFGVNVGHHANILPDFNARLSKNFRRSLLEFRYGRNIVPGNGIFLTSRRERIGVTYSYEGIRRWTIALDASYNTMGALVQELGDLNTYMAGLGVTRKLGKNFHMVLRADARRYELGASQYNRNAVRTTIGVAYSPGDRPLALW